MATAGMSANKDVRLNDLDWEILEIMADGNRYTPQHLYDDILENEGAGWTRQRVRHLAENGLVEQVGTSRMYEISNWGQAALDVRDEADEDETPKDFTQRVIKRAERQSGDRADS